MMYSIKNSLSAIEAVGVKMAVTADNTANSQSEGFKKSRAVISEGDSSDVRVEITRDETPGPMVNKTVEGEIKTTEMSNVDLTEEIPSMLVTKQGYDANLRSVRAQDEMMGMIIDVVS